MKCEICNKILNDWHGLSVHLTNQHKEITHEEYYKQYINSTKCTCQTCGKSVPFLNIRIGYKLHCNTKCARNDDKTKTKMENTMLENNVHIITDCTKYLNYVNNKYGKNYINNFRKENKDV